MASSELIKTGFQIKFKDNKGNFNFDKIKNHDVTDDDIRNLANAFASLQEFEPEKIYKTMNYSINLDDDNSKKKIEA